MSLVGNRGLCILNVIPVTTWNSKHIIPIFGSFRLRLALVWLIVSDVHVHTLPTQSQFPRDRHKNRKFSTKSLRAIVAHSHICRSFGAKVSIRLCLFARHSDETIKKCPIAFLLLFSCSQWSNASPSSQPVSLEVVTVRFHAVAVNRVFMGFYECIPFVWWLDRGPRNIHGNIFTVRTQNKNRKKTHKRFLVTTRAKWMPWTSAEEKKCMKCSPFGVTWLHTVRDKNEEMRRSCFFSYSLAHRITFTHTRCVSPLKRCR